MVAGLASAADKRKYAKPKAPAVLSDSELEAVYIDDGLGARVIDAIPEDMFRQGWRFVFDGIADEKEQKEKAQVYTDIFDNLKLKTKLSLAHKWARLYGGAVVLLGALDGQTLDKPLKPKNIRHFDALRVIDRSDISFFQIRFQLDPLQPRYGLPELYPVRFEGAGGAEETRFVHHSRILEIHGKLVPEGAAGRLTREQRYWGVSDPLYWGKATSFRGRI
jgi:phage-related protein (TIGR01555 family)